MMCLRGVSVWWPPAVKELWLARESLWASKGRPNCSPRGLLTLSRPSRVQGEPALICEENGPPNANWHTAVSTGPTDGAFMLSVLSLLHGCVWQNWHQCTIMSVFNHRLNDRSVKRLRDRQIVQRDMLQQFQKYETEYLFASVFSLLLFLYQCLCGDTVWVATPIFQENTAAAYRALMVSKNRSNCVMTPSVYNKQSDRLSGYPGTLGPWVSAI